MPIEKKTYTHTTLQWVSPRPSESALKYYVQQENGGNFGLFEESWDSISGSRVSLIKTFTPREMERMRDLFVKVLEG